MATLHVRNVPDPLYEALRARAEDNGRSIGAEAVSVLEQHLVVDATRRHVRAGRRRRAGGGLFTRFTEDARGVVVAAQNEARALGHAHVGSGHLLLGLLVHGTGAGPEALRTLGLTLGRTREQLAELVPPGEGPAGSRLPFQADAKKALELALREALALRHDYIGTEHVLLGIVRAGEGAGAEIVRLVEPDAGAVRAAVLQTLALEGHRFETRPVSIPGFRVVELEGSTGEWEARLNEAAAQGFDLVEIVDRRAIFRCE